MLDQFGPSPTSEISFQQLKACSYITHVINETFRVAAVIPLNERVAVRDTTLPRGGGPDGSQPIFIPKGRQVLIATYAMQHRADIWGEDVEEFRPERWEEGRKVGFEFIPFGAGTRSCLGRKWTRHMDSLFSSHQPCVCFLFPTHQRYYMAGAFLLPSVHGYARADFRCIEFISEVMLTITVA